MIYLISYSELTVYFINDHQLLRGRLVSRSQGVKEHPRTRQITGLQLHLIVAFDKVPFDQFHGSARYILDQHRRLSGLGQVESDQRLALEGVRYTTGLPRSKVQRSLPSNTPSLQLTSSKIVRIPPFIPISSVEKKLLVYLGSL